MAKKTAKTKDQKPAPNSQKLKRMSVKELMVMFQGNEDAMVRVSSTSIVEARVAIAKEAIRKDLA